MWDNRIHLIPLPTCRYYPDQWFGLIRLWNRSEYCRGIYVVMQYCTVPRKNVSDSCSRSCNIFHTGCGYPRVEKTRISSPPDQIFWNALSVPLLQYFIYVVHVSFRDSNRCQFLCIKLPINRCFVQIFQFVDRSWVL